MILHALHALVHVHGRCSYIFGEDWWFVASGFLFLIFPPPEKVYIGPFYF